MGGRGVNAYMFLLCEAWLQDPPGSLPNDEDLLIELARVTPKEWQEIWPILKPKFQLNGDGRIHNTELHKEAQTRVVKQKAGKSRWKKAEQNT
jgi:uncharacterized protein YdaU (DUF1376 family)